MTYEQWWWEFIAEHEDWKYADSDALRRAAFNGGQESLRQQYDDCVRQLTEDHARIDRLESEPKGWWHKEVEDLRHQLAAALAACKVKDEALMLPCDRWNKTQFLIVQKALAVQPDDSALKLWLGEPVGEVKKYTGSLKDMAIIVWTGEQLEEGTLLYAPKGMTK